MENLKWVLSLQDQSPQVQELLQCLGDEFDLDVYICSVGGVGSTELSNFLTRHGVRCNLLTDQDAVRHVNRPPPRLGCGRTRVVYLYGDPLASVASHYRRGMARHQALKTSGDPRLVDPGFPATFEEYVERGEDLFGIERHLDDWLTQPTGYDILFVRYDDMFEPEVARALFSYTCGHLPTGREGRLQQMADAWCASKRERRSAVTEEQRRRMYAALHERMRLLPAAFLRGPDGELKATAEAIGS